MPASRGDDDRLDLLLADAEERRPILDGGLPGEAAQRAPKPKKAPRGDDAPRWRRVDANPNDLPEQRWAVIAPEGREGSRMLEAIAPLIELRQEEQGAPAKIYRVPADMDARQAVDWKDEVYWADDVPEAERPQYLLVLGDLHHVSAELQHALAHGAYVGRVHFADAAGEPDLDGYAAYADKVARLARVDAPEASPDMVFFAAQDGTTATRTGEVKLVKPSLAAAEQARQRGQFPAASVREIAAETVDELLAAGAAGARPAVLLSVSHGLGPPRRGFGSAEEQQRRQGALVLGRDEILDAERLQGQRFLPGGMWLCVSCFGAGTPSTSAYATWLSHLAEEGAWSGAVEQVLKSLPAGGQRPFVAAMPQAALRSPEGPLAVLGHLDLAWTYGFVNAKNLSESRIGRMLSALQVMVRGGRAGVALEALLRFYRETNDALMMTYELEADARAQGRQDPTDRVERGHLWMLRNDLRGYVLLGDPAARMPLRRAEGAAKAPRPTPAPPEARARVQGPGARAEAGAAGPDGIGAAPRITSLAAGAGGVERSVRDKEAAVLALLGGDEAPRAIAARAGVSLETLWMWLDAYRAGGRERLSG